MYSRCHQGGGFILAPEQLEVCCDERSLKEDSGGDANAGDSSGDEAS